MTQTNLAELALEDRLDELERAWNEVLADPGEIGPYCKVLDTLCERDAASRALNLASTLVDALAERDRQDDAFRVGMTLVHLDAHNDGLAKRLFGLIEERFSEQPWYEMILGISGLQPDRVTRDALDSFERTRCYTEGHVVYHRGGWGEGLVEEFYADRRELRIRFATGRTQEIPLTTALESMQPLAPDDLRTMILTDQEELQRLAKEQPSILIRKVAKIYRGRVNSTEVKGALSPAVIPAKKWASFWKRAKAAAAVDPYLQVEGSTTRPVFELRKKPLSFAEEAVRSLRHCDDLGEEVALIREYLERSNDREVQDTILAIAQEHIETALREGRASHAHILDGVLLLEAHDRHSSTSAATQLRTMLVTDGELEPENFDLLATQDAREHAVRLLPEALGENWVDLCIDKLLKTPASVLEPIVGLLTERGHGARLLVLWDQVAPYPRRHPVLTYLLGRAWADGAFEGQEGKPGQIAVGRVLLHLSRVLAGAPKKDTAMTRLQTRLTSLLIGRRNVLQNLLEDIGRKDLSTYLGICERGGNDFPQEVLDLVLRTVAKRFPDLTAKPEKPFWDDESAIYVTRDGLARQREEYRRLVDELIPANSKAIGAAAALGDLSENSEWEAAMEEQRNLTARAKAMDDELRKAKLLEDRELPEHVVVPGTAVTYTLTDSGEQHTIRILGPWDAIEEGIVNYLAPLARPLLGKRVGDTVDVMSEHGEHPARIDAIERIL